MESRLKELVSQTGTQLLFSPELADGVQAHGVHGYYTVREALDRMLSDTGLAASYNEQAGIIEITKVDSHKGNVVRLPPYTVQSAVVVWRYARMGDIELLSSCRDDVTQRVIVQLFRLREALAQILPPDLMFHAGSPAVYVLHSDQNKAGVPPEMLEALRKDAAGRPVVRNIDVMRSYSFWDVDSRGVYFILDELGFQYGRLTLRGDYVRELLSRRSPTLPTWFVEGMVELYRTIKLDPYGAKPFSMDAHVGQRIPGGVAVVEPFVWSPDGKTTVANQPDATDMIPMAQLITAPPPGDGDPLAPAWRAQAALFVRWALDRGRHGPESLWQFVRLADTKTPDEADFQACFDLKFAQADRALAGYLPKAVRRGFELKPRRFAEMPNYDYRMANEIDVALVKGELDRLKIDYVRRFAPALTKRYIDNALDTLELGQGLGEVARWSALMGLCQCDAGNDALALPYLEKAVQGGCDRPRAYYELARIRMNRALAASPDGRLATNQVDELVRILTGARKHSPALRAAYDLLAQALSHTDPTPSQLGALADGLTYFPRDWQLILTVSKFYREGGVRSTARLVLDRGLDVVIEPNARKALLDARQAL